MSKLNGVLLTTISSWVARLITAFAQLIAMRLLLGGLGEQQYAIFVVMVGLTNFFLLADLGIGSSLQNFISEKRAKEEHYSSELVAAVIILLLGFFISIALFLVFSNSLGEWLFNNYEDDIRRRAVKAFSLCGVILIATSVFSIVYKIQYAEHEGHKANIMTAAAVLVGTAGVYIVNNFIYIDKLYWSVITYILPGAIFPAIILSRKIFKLIPIHGLSNIAHSIKSIFRRGAGFWIFSILATLTLQVDYIVMARVLESRDIVIYNVGTKIFGLSLFLYTAVLSALWPRCAELFAKKDISGVWIIIRRTIQFGLLWMLIFTIFMIFASKWIVSLITNGQVTDLPSNFIILLGIYNSIRIWADSFAMILMSASITRPFMLIVPVQALLSVFGQIFLANHFGYYGIIIGIMLSFLLTVCWYLPLALRSYEKNSQGNLG